MENSGILIWQNEKIGDLSNIVNDMWYLEADWRPSSNTLNEKLKIMLSKYNSSEIIKDPAKGIIAEIIFNDAPSDPQKFLILNIEESNIFMRLINDEIAAYGEKKLPASWTKPDNPDFYIKLVKDAIIFFHPLKWKKLKAIGISNEQNKVLFEILKGRYQYGLVHINFKKESINKIPKVNFYKDWNQLYLQEFVNYSIPNEKEQKVK